MHQVRNPTKWKKKKGGEIGLPAILWFQKMANQDNIVVDTATSIHSVSSSPEKRPQWCHFPLCFGSAWIVRFKSVPLIFWSTSGKKIFSPLVSTWPLSVRFPICATPTWSNFHPPVGFNDAVNFVDPMRVRRKKRKLIFRSPEKQKGQLHSLFSSGVSCYNYSALSWIWYQPKTWISLPVTPSIVRNSWRRLFVVIVVVVDFQRRFFSPALTPLHPFFPDPISPPQWYLSPIQRICLTTPIDPIIM